MDNTLNYAGEKASGWMDALVVPLQDLASQVFTFIPQIISALIVLIIGMFIVGIIMKLLGLFLDKANVDAVMEKTGITGELKKAGINITLSSVLKGVVKLFLKLVVLIAVVDVLQITQLIDFLNQIVLYLPNVFVAVILLAVGLMLAKKVSEIVEKSLGSVQSTKASAALGGKIAKYSILGLTVMVTVSQLGVAVVFMEALFSGIVAAIAIALGLAFGLGGKNTAENLLNKIQK